MSTTVQKQHIVSPLYDKGRKLNRRLRREAAQIDAQLAQARKQWFTGDVPPLLITYAIDPSRTRVQMSERAAVNAIAHRIATPVGSFELEPQMIADGIAD